MFAGDGAGGETTQITSHRERVRGGATTPSEETEMRESAFVSEVCDVMYAFEIEKQNRVLQAAFGVPCHRTILSVELIEWIGPS